MSDDDWGMGDGEGQKEEKPAQPAEQQIQTGRGRGRERKRDQQNKSQQKVEEPKNINEQSQSWIDNSSSAPKVEDQNLGIAVTKDKAEGGSVVKNITVEQNISEIIQPNATELQSQPLDDSWAMIENKSAVIEKKQEKNNDENQGRREGRGNRGRQSQQNNFRGGFQGNGEQNNSGGQRGNRGNRGGYQSNNAQSQTTTGGQNRRGNRDNGYGARDYNNGNQGEFNNRGRGGYRGNREGGFNRDGDNQEGRNFGRNREEGGDNFRNGRNFQRGNNERGGFRGRGRGDNLPYRGGNDRNFNNNSQQRKTEVPKIQKVVVPLGRRAWPACEIYIIGGKLSITLRKVQQFNCKLLIVPYRSLKMDYYPGNFVISGGKLDYREKIRAKGVQLEKGGKVYFQKAIGLSNYLGVAFLKIDDSDQSTVEASLKDGIQLLLRDVGNLKIQQKFDSAVFGLCEQLCSAEKLLKIFTEQMTKYQSIKQIYLCTKDPKFFVKCISDYQKYINDLIDENQILME